MKKLYITDNHNQDEFSHIHSFCQLYYIVISCISSISLKRNQRALNLVRKGWDNLLNLLHASDWGLQLIPMNKEFPVSYES